MDRPIEKTRHLARTSLDVALTVAIWLGVMAMGFGLFSWLQATAPLPTLLAWVRQIFG